MMKHKGLKLTKTLTCMVLAATMLVAGCGKDTQGEGGTIGELGDRYSVDANTPAWQLDTKEETTLTWYVNADWWNTDWGTDVVTKKIKEDLNLNVEFVTGDDTKLNTYFAGDDLPDIITIFDSSSTVAQSANQWAYSLTELADAYDPYFYNVAKEDTLGWFQLSDGKTYGYPDYSNSQEDYDDGYIEAATAFVIRKDIYEGLGEPSMNTQEEFLDVLRDIKSAYPDVTPFGFNEMSNSVGSLGPDFQNFIGVPILNEDNTWYDRDMDEDYLSWIHTFNEAYREGLISDDSFSDDGTAYEEKIKVGQFATIMIGGTPQRSGALQVYMNNNPESAYMAIDGPQSTVGHEPTLAQSGLSGWAVNYITNNCSDPVKAIQLFTYLLSDDAGVLTTYGIEGETYEIGDDGQIALLPEIQSLKEEDNDRFKKEVRLGEFCLFGHDRYHMLSADSTASTKQMREWGEGKLKTQFQIENIQPDQGSAEARSLSAIDTNWVTTLVSMIRSADDATFTQLLEEHKQFRANNGWDSIVKVRNEKIQRNIEKLTK